MALDPRILLQNTTPDLMSAIQGGIRAGQAIRRGPLEDALLRSQSSAAAQGKGLQFGGQITLKDEKGNLFLGTSRRNPNTGDVEPVVTPLSGSGDPVGQLSQVGSTGLTGEEKVKQAGDIQQVTGDIKTEQELESISRKERESLEKRQQLELQKIKIDETKFDTEEGRLQAVAAKKARSAESLTAVDKINSLLADDRFSSAFGRVVTATPEALRSQESIDVRADVDQIIGLLSLESRQKLKGQGTITDSEAKTLEQSATTLANPRLSDEAVRRELRRVRGIFEESAARNRVQQSEAATPQEVVDQPPLESGIKFLGFE